MENEALLGLSHKITSVRAVWQWDGYTDPFASRWLAPTPLKMMTKSYRLTGGQ